MRRPAISAVVVVLIGASIGFAACRPGTPVIDPGPRPPTSDGTISGTVRGPEGTSPITGRLVEVINVATGERQRATTSNTGGFTFKVKPGKYRVEVALETGESIVKRPDVMNVNRSDVDAHADFVLSGSRAARPKSPSVGGSLGLRAPIA
jgi:Carboxypeptidase regulatory-like domain